MKAIAKSELRQLAATAFNSGVPITRYKKGAKSALVTERQWAERARMTKAELLAALEKAKEVALT
jgi:hypothetical protein